MGVSILVLVDHKSEDKKNQINFFVYCNKIIRL